MDVNGNEIFNSGEVPLPAPTRDVAVEWGQASTCYKQSEVL